MADSPTCTVGYPVVSSLEKVRHEFSLLSLEKTKLVNDLLNFQGNRRMNLSYKLDGLTTELIYEGGIIRRLSTRGDGEVGEDITHNSSAIGGIPQTIPYKSRLVVVGESFICKSDFAVLKDTLLDSSGKAYKNSRNLAAGSVRAYDSEICAGRRVTFLPFAVLAGLEDIEEETDSKQAKLMKLVEFGFGKVRSIQYTGCREEILELHVNVLRQKADEDDIPIDGLVLSFDEISYSKSCGRTGHHFKDGLAFKFEDSLTETNLQYIEWNPTRSDEISPVAVFTPVEIDDCEVSRASLHNLTFIEELELMPGCRVLVSKRNMIIPHVEENLDRGSLLLDELIPHTCPCCGEPTRLHITRSVISGKERITKTLFCDNSACEMQRLKQFVHFVSKKAMGIDGLSEATLEKLIGRGWIHSFLDIYRLDRYQNEIIHMEGFGEKSWRRLWNAIQASKNTTFERYLISMDIPMIGNTTSRELSRRFSGDLNAFEAVVDAGYDFTQLADFGETLHGNIHRWFRKEENRYLWEELQKMMNIEKKTMEEETETKENPFVGLTIVVTGKVEPYTRNGINAKIESLGAKAGSSVSKNTNYLICGDNAGSKLSKAQELGVSVLTPDEFFAMAGE